MSSPHNGCIIKAKGVAMNNIWKFVSMLFLAVMLLNLRGGDILITRAERPPHDAHVTLPVEVR
jgi:hypothetical protein